MNLVLAVLVSPSLNIVIIFRINGDWFPKQWVSKVQKSRGVQGHAPSGNVLDFNFLKKNLNSLSLWPI